MTTFLIDCILQQKFYFCRAMSHIFYDLKRRFHNSLRMLYEEREIDAILYIYLNDKWQIPKEQLFINDSILEDISFTNVVDDLFRLSQGEPVQYVCGKSSFFGLSFLVNPSVLIPRPETEELVHIVVKENENKSVRILDIGTGSGAIAVTLAKMLPQAEVYALDFSEETLQVARKNGNQNQVSVHFFTFDLLNDFFPTEFEKMDIIVSNPPYIPQKEKVNLHPNVVNYEPHSALFVPDNDPLIFYRCIAEKSISLLKRKGKIYLETYENSHEELGELFLSCGFSNVRSILDINGKARIMTTEMSR